MSEEASNVLRYLYHNAILTDEAKKMILQHKGKKIASHYDHSYGACQNWSHTDEPEKYFKL